MKTAAYTGAPPAAGTYAAADVTMNAYGGISAIASGTAPALTYAVIPITSPSTFSAAGNLNQITWAAATYDPSSIRTNSTTLTIPSTGLWMINFNINYDDSSFNSFVMYYKVNGSIVAARYENYTSSNVGHLDNTLVLRLTAADVVTVHIQVAGTASMETSYADTNVITLVKLSS